MAARHVVSFGRLVHHLIHGQGQEIAKHDIDNRTQPGHRRADTDSREACFGDGCVEDSLRSEFFDQTRENFERRSRLCDVFAENTHP